MASSEKYISLLNFLGSPYNIPYTSHRFQRVLIRETSIEVHQGQLHDKTGTLQTQMPLKRASFETIFQQSAAVVIHDSMFARESFLVETSEFWDHGGLDALVEYFRRGGKVIVQVVEGIYAIGNILSSKFGCRWKLQAIDSGTAIVTERGRQMLGYSVPSTVLLQGKAHFMRAPRVEALISKKVLDREEFVKQYQPDSEEEEEEYISYKKGEEGQHVICIYEGFGSEGQLIWNGDRGQNAVLKAAFEVLLKL